MNRIQLEPPRNWGLFFAINITAPILDARLKALEELRWHVGNTLLHILIRLSPKEVSRDLCQTRMAANLAGALKVAQGIDEGVVVTVLPDDTRKYGSRNLEA